MGDARPLVRLERLSTQVRFMPCERCFRGGRFIAWLSYWASEDLAALKRRTRRSKRPTGGGAASQEESCEESDGDSVPSESVSSSCGDSVTTEQPRACRAGDGGARDATATAMTTELQRRSVREKVGRLKARTAAALRRCGEERDASHLDGFAVVARATRGGFTWTSSRVFATVRPRRGPRGRRPERWDTPRERLERHFRR